MSLTSAIVASANSIGNQSDSSVASSGVLGAIKNAALKTGVDFSYLVQKATAESGLNPTAKASTSSATGLFQFTNQTWLQMVKNTGAQYGLGDYASQITTDASGHLSVGNGDAKKAILALRNDPTLSAEMAGELDKQNAASLQQNVGGKIGSTELYLAHFLGAGGASEFLSAMHSTPSASAASIVPDAAAANPSVFYSKTGEPRSLEQIYQHFASKFDSSPTSAQIASASTASLASPTSGTSISAATSAVMASLNARQLSQASAVAAFKPTIMNVAQIYQSAPSAPSTDATPISGYSSSSAGSVIASAGPSTLFTAMLLGQMNGAASSTHTGADIANEDAAKKKGTLAVLSSVA